MTAASIAALLAAQAAPAPHRLALTDAVLGTAGLDALVQSDLRRPKGAALLLGVDPKAIPAQPPAGGFTIPVTVPAGADGFLALDGRDATLQVLVGTGATPTVDVQLTVETTTASKVVVPWTFSTSFPELAGLPYDRIDLGKPQLVLSTGAAGLAAKGLGFAGTLELTGAFASVATLLGLSTGYGLAGQIDGSGDDLTFDLEAPFDLGTPPTIGGLVTLDQAGAGVSLTPVKAEDGTVSRLTQLYLGAQVVFENTAGTKVPLDLRAGMPQAGSTSVLVLTVTSPPGFQTTIDRLGSLLGGNTWDSAFSGPLQPVKGVLDAFGLRAYTIVVGVSNASVMSMVLDVGTLPGTPWSMWAGGPTLDLDVRWMLTFLGGGTQSSLLLTADFAYKGIEFELSVAAAGSGLQIEGTEKGTLPPLRLSDLNKTVFDGHLVVPDDLLTVQVEGLSFGVDTATKRYTVGAVASASVGLFGTQVLGVRSMALTTSFDASGDATTYTATLDGEVFLGPITFQADATISNAEGVDTVFTLHLVDETVGTMLGHLVHIVDPTYDVSFGEPWDSLLDVSLDAFVLEINVTQGSVALEYAPPGGLDLGFLTIDKVGLSYTRAAAGKAAATKVEIEGSLLGIPFPGADTKPLAWDPINEAPPAVPGAGSKLFDLEYAGLGQHVGLGGDPATMDAVMKQLRASAAPVQPGALPAFGKDLVFAGDRGWLIGAQFTVMDTVALQAVFNDPDLYGLVVQLQGEKAQLFKGLRFEILYRKVTDTIGVYHVELQLPDVMRHLEFGEVAITLPIVTVDIYTNGNFRIDLGFPNGLDFSRSFSLQVFPFVGYGGLYFALLDGATSSRVPTITNGTFSPVVEFGVALSVGVGKDINEGILKGGMSVTVVGILEGVLGWFHPTDSAPAETYYWVKGTIAVTGQLYATIDFAIIQASVDVTAYISATLIVEAHQPIHIEASAGVSVRVSVKIVFFTIHLSFQATIDASFTIGSASPTPWIVAPGGASSDGSRRLLTGQETLHAPVDQLVPGRRKALRRLAAAARTDEPLVVWPAVCVMPGGAPVDVTLHALVAVAKSETAANEGDAVMLLTAASSTPPDAYELHEHRMLAGEDPASAAFNVLLQAMLAWGIYAETGATAATGTVTADDLADLRAHLEQPETVAAAFDPGTLAAFLAANVAFDVEPADTATPTSVALFPMFPAVTLTDTLGTSVTFDAPKPADATYVEKVRAYFRLLQVQFDQRSAGGLGDARADDGVSVATMLFSQYFSMLLSTAVKAAIDLLAAYPYTVGAGEAGTAPMSIAEVGTAIGDATLTAEPLRVVTPNQDEPVLATGAAIALPDVVVQVRAGDTFASLAAGLAAAGAQGASGAFAVADLLAANGTAPAFVAGTALPVAGLPYVSAPGDTVALLATRLLVRLGGASLLGTITGLGTAVDALVVSSGLSDPNALLPAGTSVKLPGGGVYTAVAGDTLTLVAAYAAAPAQGLVAAATYAAALQAANPGLPQDPTAPIAAGTALTLAAGPARNLAPGDTIASLATLLTTTPAAIGVALAAVPGGVLAPQATLHAPLTHVVAAGQTLSGIAATYDLTLDALARSVATTPGLFAHGADLTVADVESVAVATLLDDLIDTAEGNNAAGMVSRFLLSGIRLPDPDDPTFAALSVADLANPTKLAGIVTSPAFALSRQQFPIGASVPDGYAITLSAPAGTAGLTLGGAGSHSVTFGLAPDQAALLAEVATTPLTDDVRTLTRLALYRMQPPRVALSSHVAWQAAAPPASCVPPGTAAGNPSVWRFPDALVTVVEQTAAAAGGAPLDLELVTAKAVKASAPPVTSEASHYAWATVVDLTVSRPVTDGPAASVANAYVVEGADDTGAALLQGLQARVAAGDAATLYLLYAPDPTSSAPSGLRSDVLSPGGTYLLKTNLSTLTHGGPDELRAFAAGADPTDVYAAPLNDPADFLALLWEASITRSGGFYLSYATADGGAGLPAEAFGTSGTARLSLVALLQPASGAGGVLPVHNCAVLGDNVDPTVTSLFVQPTTRTVQAGDTLTTVAAAVAARRGTPFAASDVAVANATTPQILAVGATVAASGAVNGPTVTVGYGDTFASVVAAFAAHGQTVDVATLGTVNADVPGLLALGATLQFAPGVLSPATIVPPGVVGFELARTNPDPGLAFADVPAVQALYNMVGWSLAGTGPFVASGQGLPTTPTDRALLQADGRTPLALGDAARAADDGEARWYYRQTIVVAPFGTPQNGSASPALPSPADNPYNGIGLTGDALGEATIDLTLRDPYGGEQPLPHAGGTLSVPVGYYDDLVGPSAWPSTTLSYRVEGPPVVLVLGLALQQARYVPSPALSVATALAAVAADLQAYTAIHHQLAQPDVRFALETSLVVGDDGKTPVSTALDAGVFAAHADAAYVYLAALATLTPFRVTVPDGGATLQALVADYGTTAAGLLAANGSQPYAALLGTVTIAVPWVTTTVEADTLELLVARQPTLGLTPATLAAANVDVPLNPGVDLAAGTRTVVATPGAGQTAASLAGVAAAAHASAAGVAVANASRTDVLTAGVALHWGTAAHVVASAEALADVAAALGATVAQVAQANATVPLLVAGVSLDVVDVLVATGDTLATLAALAGVGTVDALATANSTVPNLFAPATPLLLGTAPKADPTPPAPDDTLASFAAANGVTLDQLADANDGSRGTSATFVAAAVLDVPGTVEQGPGPRYSTFAAPADATAATIAPLFGATPDEITALNPQTPAAGRSWICPPMRGDAFGANPTGTLSGLAAAYRTDVASLATANAAALGVLQAGVALTVAGRTYTTKAHDTLNGVVVGLGGVTLAQVTAAVADVPGMVVASAPVVAPPAAGVDVPVPVAPRLGSAVTTIAVEVVATRDAALVDPDFADAPTVLTARTAVGPDTGASAEAEQQPAADGAADADPAAPDADPAAPDADPVAPDVEPVVPDPDVPVDPGVPGDLDADPDPALSLDRFAAELEAALPGVHVATGAAVAEGDAPSAATLWLVNFDAPTAGPTITYTFRAPSTTYYALPPLSVSLMSGDLPIVPYVTGQQPPFSGSPDSQSFRAVDLDGWLDTFLGAVDLVLSPSYAVPAYALSPASTAKIVGAKQRLAEAIAGRVQPVLVGTTGTPAAASDALLQALLTRLSSAFSVNTLVQVPVDVTSSSSDPLAAPRLSGQVVERTASPDAPPAPQAYSFSTAKVPLTNGGSAATFLFSVKAAAEHRELGLSLEYVVTELELPDPSATIGDYEGSSWLRFVRPVARTGSTLDDLVIPVPLRAYPGPVTLATQSATQSVAAPASAADLVPWDFAFTYEHDDAEQDTPLVEVAFNTTLGDAVAAQGGADATLDAVFAALAQFIAAWPALQDDLAMLSTLEPGATSPSAAAAVDALAWLVDGVAGAFDTPSVLGAPFAPPPTTLYYQLQKEQTTTGGADATLTQLVVTAMHPAVGPNADAPPALWPSAITATYDGTEYPLTPVGAPTASQATFAYPAGAIPASAQIAQAFRFDWPGSSGAGDAAVDGVAVSVAGDGAVAVGAPQSFVFGGVDALGQQSGVAGVSIWRNVELVANVATNDAFVYRTPVTSFTSSAIPSIVAADPIAIGAGPTGVGEALGTFLQSLLATREPWKAGDTVAMRFAGGYSYALATTGTDILGPVVPIFLVASLDFDPQADWDWTTPTSFVAQVDALIEDWQATNQPNTDGASVVFDMTVYASGGQHQPLIHATTLRYDL